MVKFRCEFRIMMKAKLSHFHNALFIEFSQSFILSIMQIAATCLDICHISALVYNEAAVFTQSCLLTDE